MLRLLRSSLLFVGAALVLTGCPEEGALCQSGTVACADVCVDTNTDSLHCGACGQPCGEGQTCQQGQCKCREGAELCPSGTCAVLANDSSNCGACGNACAAGQFCQSEQCVLNCDSAFTACGTSCVNLQTDAAHCGGCDSACSDVQTCRAGVCTYDAVAACYGTGEVVGFRATGEKGQVKPLGNNPQSLGHFGGVVLAADGSDTILRQASLPNLELLANQNATGASPTHISSDGDFVYVTASVANSVLVLQKTGDRGEGGYTFNSVKSIFTGDATAPQAALKVGNELFVPLQGAFPPGDPMSGQKIARINLTDPANPTDAGIYELSPLNPTDFADSHPYPQGGVAKGGMIYVPLTNIDPTTFGPGGNGYLVKLDPGAATDPMTLIDLGAECTNSGAVAVAGESLVVSCGGKLFDPLTPGAGVVLVGADDTVKSRVTFAGFNPGRLSVFGDRVLVGNAAGGTLATLQLTGETLTVVHGPGGAEALAICAQPPEPGFTNVADVISLP